MSNNLLFSVFFYTSFIQILLGSHFQKRELLFLGPNNNPLNLQNGTKNNPFSKIDLFFERVLKSKSKSNSFMLSFNQVTPDKIYKVPRDLAITNTKIVIRANGQSLKFIKAKWVVDKHSILKFVNLNIILNLSEFYIIEGDLIFQNCRITLIYGNENKLTPYIYNFEADKKRSRRIVLNSITFENQGINNSLSSFIDIYHSELNINNLTIYKQKMPDNMVLFSVKFSNLSLQYMSVIDSSIYMIIYLVQSRLQMNHSNFQNCLMAGVGMAIYQSNFKDEIALNDNLNFNVKIRKSNIFRRFGLSKFYPQAKNEINYFSFLFLRDDIKKFFEPNPYLKKNQQWGSTTVKEVDISRERKNFDFHFFIKNFKTHSVHYDSSSSNENIHIKNFVDYLLCLQSGKIKIVFSNSDSKLVSKTEKINKNKKIKKNVHLIYNDPDQTSDMFKLMQAASKDSIFMPNILDESICSFCANQKTKDEADEKNCVELKKNDKLKYFRDCSNTIQWEKDGVKYNFKQSVCDSCSIIYGNYYVNSKFISYSNKCYSQVTAEFMIIILIIAYCFYDTYSFFIRFNGRCGNIRMADLDQMVKLQTDEIKKLNVEIIALKSRNENLRKIKSYCALELRKGSMASLAESETYLMTKLRKTSLSNYSNESIQLDQESSSGGDVTEEIWPVHLNKLEMKLKGNLLYFIFKKTAKYTDPGKFHKVSIFCSKEYNRKITEIDLKFHPSPGLVLAAPKQSTFLLNLETAFHVEIFLKQANLGNEDQYFVSIDIQYKYEQNLCQDTLNIALPNSWFLDFLSIKPREIPEILKTYSKDISRDEEDKTRKYVLVHPNPEEVLAKTENIYEYIDETCELGTKQYVALFKELFCGNYVEFLLILRFDQKFLYLTLKMEKKNIAIEMNGEELHMEFEYLTNMIQEYFNQLI